VENKWKIPAKDTKAAVPMNSRQNNMTDEHSSQGIRH
jgi:hypothetical protein